MPYVDTGEVRLHYVQHGSGPEPLVFVHGYTSSLRNWECLFPLLPARYTATFFDLRGAGESDDTPGGHNPATYAVDIAKATRALGIETFTLIGHSMGGGTAMQFAVEYPERLRNLVLVAPVSSNGIQNFDPTLRQMQRSIRHARDLRLQLARAMAVRETSDAVHLRRIEDELKWSVEALDEAFQGMVELRIGERVAQLRVPTLMLVGDRDGLRPANLEDAARIPNCALHVFYRVGHEVYGDVPEEFMAVLDDFCQNGAGAMMTMEDRRRLLESVVSAPAAAR